MTTALIYPSSLGIIIYAIYCYVSSIIPKLNHAPKWHFMVGFVLSVVVTALCFKRVHGIFGEPSVLTVSLCLFYVSTQVAGTRFLVNQQALCWFGLSTFVIVLMSLGALSGIGVDFYHHYTDVQSVIYHYGAFALVFVVAFYLDKKTLILAWICLVAYVSSLMNSQFILDYVADVWLFLLALFLMIRGFVYAIRHKLLRSLS